MFSKQFFYTIKGSEKTSYNSGENGFFEYNNEPLVLRTADHLAGTHLMGTDNEDTVVDKYQRSHDYKNLFLAGAGNMPSMGTANPTLTVAALSFWVAENIDKDLRGQL